MLGRFPKFFPGASPRPAARSRGQARPLLPALSYPGCSSGSASGIYQCLSLRADLSLRTLARPETLACNARAARPHTAGTFRWRCQPAWALRGPPSHLPRPDPPQFPCRGPCHWHSGCPLEAQAGRSCPAVSEPPGPGPGRGRQNRRWPGGPFPALAQAADARPHVAADERSCAVARGGMQPRR